MKGWELKGGIEEVINPSTEKGRGDEGKGQRQRQKREKGRPDQKAKAQQDFLPLPLFPRSIALTIACVSGEIPRKTRVRSEKEGREGGREAGRCPAANTVKCKSERKKDGLNGRKKETKEERVAYYST